MRTWTDRLLGFALAAAAAAWLLNWAWQLLQPLIPAVVVIGGLGVLGAAAVRRLRQW